MNWTTFGRTYRELPDDLKEGGVLVELQSTNVFNQTSTSRDLLGDVNTMLGTCDCCGGDTSVIVVRYLDLRGVIAKATADADATASTP